MKRSDGRENYNFCHMCFFRCGHIKITVFPSRNTKTDEIYFENAIQKSKRKENNCVYEKRKSMEKEEDVIAVDVENCFAHIKHDSYGK